LAFSLSVFACESARALTITADFDSTITGDTNHVAIEAGINSAIATYETMFLNPINVTITFTEDPTGLGGSLTNYLNDTYTDYRAKLAASATSASDTTALAHLPTQTKNPVNSNNNLTLATANAAALGIFTGTNSLGGQIFLNPSAMNLTRTSINPNKYDLISVVEHELDEVLGLGSALVNGSNGQPAPTGPIMPMDLFRYNQSGVRSFNTGTDSATQAYFSLDGTTHIARFNQTSDASTGGDFGDWWSFSGTQTPQVQDAYGTPGIVVDVGTAEKTALDAIGYTLLTNKFTWNATSSGTGPVDGSQVWSTAGGSKWWNGTANSIWKNSPVQNAQFGTPGTVGTTAYSITMSTAITVGTITFANQHYTIAASTNALTINSGIMAIANATVAAPVILGANNSWETIGTAILTVSGNVSGGFGITKQGPGTLIMSGSSNTYTGATTVNSGTLQLNSAGALPTGGNVVIAGGTLDIHGQTLSIGNLTFGDGVSLEAPTLTDSGATAGVLTLGGNVTYTGTFNGGFTYSSPVTIAHNLQLASGTHHFTSADTAVAANYDIVVSGVMAGAGGLTKDGTSFYMALTGANTYTGATVINAGFFYAAAANTLPSASAVTVNSGGVLSLNPTVAQTGVVVGDYSQTIGSLAGGGSVLLDAATLTTGGDGTSTTFSGTISGAGGIVHKAGAGTMTLSGANTFTGNLFVDAGTVLVSGSLTGLTRVNSGGTLSGTGTTGTVSAVSGGTVRPGSATGSGLLNTKGFTLSSGAHLSLELGGTTGTGTSGTLYSELKVTGTVSLSGDVQFSLFGGFTPHLNDIFYIILNDGTDLPSGTFSNAVGGIITNAGIQYQVNYAANGDGGAAANDVSLKVIAVPEPGAGMMALTGLVAGLGGLRPRRRVQVARE